MPTIADLSAAEQKLNQLRKQLRDVQKGGGKAPADDGKTVGQRQREAKQKKAAEYGAALRNVDPVLIHNAKRRRQCEHDDPRFLRIYFPDAFYNPFTSAQEEFIEDCGRALRYGTRKAKAMPRRSGKSTIVKYLQIKYALYRQLRFPLILAATTTKARQILRDIKAKLRSPVNKKLHQDFPFETSIIRYVAPATSRQNNVTWGGLPVHIEWGPDHFILPSLPDGPGDYPIGKYGLPKDPGQIGTIEMCLGFTSDSLQGLNMYDVRPDFVMIDDLDSRDSLAAKHGVVADKIEECLDKNVAGLGGQNRRLGRVFICTITSRRSAAFRYTAPEHKPAWDGDRVPAIAEWPAEPKAYWDEYVRLRQSNKREDKYGRKARDYLVEHFDEMHAGFELSNPHDYNREPLEDGEPEHLSALQKCFDYIADEGMESFMTECQNDPPEENWLVAQVTPERMLRVLGEKKRTEVEAGTTMITRGVDIRKIQVHYATLGDGPSRSHLIADYDVWDHGEKNKTTQEQAEELILWNLRRLREWWLNNPHKDADGKPYPADLTLIDKGWKATWREEGELKQWATQPVETFCMESGLRQFLPAKGAPNYRSPKPARGVFIGHHWHLNAGSGAERVCDEIIWDHDYWHMLVEELFMLADEDRDRFELFEPCDGIWQNHLAFGKDITEGAKVFKDQIANNRQKKPPFVSDHWWDCLALSLVAGSVEQWCRQLESARYDTDDVGPIVNLNR